MMKKILSIILIVAAGVAYAEDRPVSEWLADAKAQRGEVADPELEELREGCMEEVSNRPHSKKKWSAKQKAVAENYRNWLEREGNALIEKWVAGETLSEEEQTLLPLAKATYLRRVWTQGGSERRMPANPDPEDLYLKDVADKGKAVLKKGFEKGMLSAEDIAALDDYSIYFAMKPCLVKRLPFELELSRHKRNQPFKPGEAAPDFQLAKLNSVLGLPTYTDSYEQNRSDFLKPGASLKLLMILDGYEGSSGGVVKKKAVITADVETTRLSDSAKNGRPAVIILAYPPDVWMKCCLGGLEVLQQAYGDQIDILFINVNYHDTYAGLDTNFFPDKEPADTRVAHPVTLEQRARLGKDIYMMYPSATVPMLLDDMAQTTRNSYYAQGGDARFLVIDRAGNVAVDEEPRWKVWTQGNYTDLVTWLNTMELEIVHLLANDGLADTARGFVPPNKTAQRAAFKGRRAKNYAYHSPWNRYSWLTGRIEKIDGNQISVLPELPPAEEMKGLQFIENSEGVVLNASTQKNIDVLKQWRKDAEAGKTYTFELADDVELFINGVEAEPDEFAEGDFVGIWYDLSGKPGGKPLHVRACRGKK